MLFLTLLVGMSLFLFLLLLGFLFVVLDILCLLLGIRLCFLFGLVCTNGYGIGLFLTENIGEE